MNATTPRRAHPLSPRRADRQHLPFDMEALEPRVLLSGDDFPDLIDFPDAHRLTLQQQGATRIWAVQIEGQIETEGDTDLFKFTVPGDTDQTVALAYQTPPGQLSPSISLMDDGLAPLAPASPDSNGVSMVSLLSSTQLTGGHTYYVLVQAGTLGGLAPDPTGSYSLVVSVQIIGTPLPPPPPPTPPPPTPPPAPPPPEWIDGDDGLTPLDDDHANEDADWDADATRILLDARTGDGVIGGRIDRIGDTDLYTFTTTAPGPVQVRVEALTTANFSASYRVLDADGIARFFGEAATAADTPDYRTVAPGATRYFVIVSRSAGIAGSYRVRVDTQPQEFFLYYPEGFSAPTVDEFIPLVNPNAAPVDYTIIARYEVGERDQILATGTLAGRSRGGITIRTRGEDAASLVRVGEPYAIEIRSTGQLGATLSHYDFGATTGESFTDRTSRTWTFAEARRDADARDFLVYHNPADQAATVTVTLVYTDGTTATFQRTVEAHRRGGINFSNDPAVPKSGVFGIRVESDQPIVAALTSYDLSRNRGSGMLGNPDGGSLEGLASVVTAEVPRLTRIAVLGSTAGEARVEITASTLDAPITRYSRTVFLPRDGRTTLSLRDLGVPAGAAVSVRYRSTMPVTLAVGGAGEADGDGLAAATAAATTSLFADAFINPDAPGTYIERLSLTNPGAEAVSVRVDYLFPDGNSATMTIEIAAGAERVIAVDRDPALLARSGPTAFSIVVSARRPVLASFAHLDRFLGGGWGTVGAPVGMSVMLE